jgi:hypothetical protein
MKLKLKISLVLCLAVGGSFIQVSVLRAQTYPPTNWVNNPFNPNPNFGIVQGHTAHPAFTNNAVNRGTLYLNSPIGASLTLANPGDAITFRGQVALTGDLNPDGNLQFRFGLLYQGSNPADTNWLGYVVGNPTGVGGDANSGLYVRNNPNPGIYTSGSPGNAMRPICEAHAYTAGWAPGDYEFALTVSQLPAKAQVVSWQLTGIAPNPYRFTGTYTNAFPLTEPPAFDQVGFMAGAGMFKSASPDNTLRFTNLTVTLSKAGAAK